MIYRLLGILLVGVIATGCAGNKTKPETTIERGDTGPDTSAASSGTQIGGGNATAMEAGAGDGMLDPFSDPASPLSKNIIYFDYNSADVEDIDIVNAHARYIAENPSARVRLEGHADERGTREYNVALSEQRAYAVKQLMLFQGVRPQQISIVAYGEERPVVYGHDEASYRENRRVEIVYESK